MLCHLPSLRDFNPRSREGSDGSNLSSKSRFCLFQSTLPRRERQKFSKHTLFFRDFNPRSREGSDAIGEEVIGVDYKFQSTLPRRERQYRLVSALCKLSISIHAPAKGATMCKLTDTFVPEISIHAPAKGATAILYNKFHFLCIILYILSAIT